MFKDWIDKINNNDLPPGFNDCSHWPMVLEFAIVADQVLGKDDDVAR
jgi:hypothetical protein